jgi:DNA-binding MarR family transcriptional regulator
VRGKILDRVVEDLFSIPPLIIRGIRRRLVKTALANIDVDISPLHFEIMKLLNEVGILHVAEIGERLHIARPQMTHLLNKLVDAGMIERRTDTADRRMINIVLTHKGKTMLEEHNSSIRNAIRETLSCLTEGELEDLSASLRKLRSIFSKLG